MGKKPSVKREEKGEEGEDEVDVDVDVDVDEEDVVGGT